MTLEEIRSKALEMAEPEFKKFEPIALENTKKVLEAFKECQVSDYHFTGTTGYGYNDVGREKLDEVFAYVFKGEKAIVRPHFVSGTHALATTLISLMGNGSKGTEFIYAVGAPYDTMQSVIGSSREVRGSLVEKGFTYTEVPLKDNTYDIEAIANAVNDNTRVVVIQRSRGYSTREPLSIADIKVIVDAVKAKNSKTICFVDNCYGEFTELQLQALKGAVYTAAVGELLGYDVFPKVNADRYDLIQAINLNNGEEMEKFCVGMQAYSPVDAHVHPIPGDMPGYEDKIIMAGGTFVQGSSIELSADGPVRPPYTIFMQGGLVFEHSMLGILGAAEELLKHR